MWSNVFHTFQKNHMECWRLILLINTGDPVWISNLEVYFYKYFQMITMIKKCGKHSFETCFSTPFADFNYLTTDPRMTH